MKTGIATAGAKYGGLGAMIESLLGMMDWSGLSETSIYDIQRVAAENRSLSEVERFSAKAAIIIDMMTSSELDGKLLKPVDRERVINRFAENKKAGEEEMKSMRAICRDRLKELFGHRSVKIPGPLMSVLGEDLEVILTLKKVLFEDLTSLGKGRPELIERLALIAGLQGKVKTLRKELGRKQHPLLYLYGENLLVRLEKQLAEDGKAAEIQDPRLYQTVLTQITKLAKMKAEHSKSQDKFIYGLAQMSRALLCDLGSWLKNQKMSNEENSISPEDMFLRVLHYAEYLMQFNLSAHVVDMIRLVQSLTAEEKSVETRTAHSLGAARTSETQFIDKDWKFLDYSSATYCRLNSVIEGLSKGYAAQGIRGASESFPQILRDKIQRTIKNLETVRAGA